MFPHRARAPRLTVMYETGMLMHMRTTLNIDDETLAKAARLGGSEKGLRPIPRRR